MTRTATTLLTLLALTAAAAAGPLRPAWVDGESTWLIHVDVAGLNESRLGRLFLGHVEHTPAGDAMNEVEHDIGLDSREVISATLFGDDKAEENTTLLLILTEAVDKVIEEASREGGHELIEIDGHPVHRWAENGGEYYAALRDGPRDGQRTLVLTGARHRIEQALQLLDGDRLTLEQARRRSTAAITTLPRKGSLIFAFAKGLPWLREDESPASAIMERSDRLMLELRERDSRTTIDAVISARSPQDARNISDILGGLLGLSRLISGEVPELHDAAHLLETIAITSDGNDIGVKLQADSDELAELLGDVANHQMGDDDDHEHDHGHDDDDHGDHD